MSAGRQRDSFSLALAESAEDSLSYELVQAVHEQLRERIDIHKESRDPDPLSLSAQEMGEILENSGFSPAETESFCRKVERDFGEDAELRPANIINRKKLEINTPEVKISVDPKFGYLISTQVVNGRKYIVISADAGVEVNGIAVDIKE